jgi:hypothetical protein
LPLTDVNARGRLERELGGLKEALGNLGVEISADPTAMLIMIGEATKHQADAVKAYADAKVKFETARRKLGVIVARWSYERSSNDDVAAVGASINSGSAKDRAGYIVLGSPRTVTLMAGDDLSTRVGKVIGECKDAEGRSSVTKGRSGIDSMFRPASLFTTTYQLLAKHIAWTDFLQSQSQFSAAVHSKQIAASLTGIADPSFVARLKALDLRLGYGGSRC